MINIFRYNKIFKIIIILLLIFSIAFVIPYFIYQINYRNGKLEININTVPKDASVIINDVSYKNGKK